MTLSEELVAAAIAGDEAEVERLIAGGADPLEPDEEGYTAADRAARAGHRSLAQRMRLAVAVTR